MTVVDSSYAIMSGVNLMADDLGLPHVAHKDVMRCIAMPLSKFLEELLGEYREGWKELYRSKSVPLELSMIRPFPETGPVLTALREKGKKIAAASNRDNPRPAMEKTGIAKYFDAIVGPGDGYLHKPDPAMLVGLMERFNMPRARTVFIGDSDIDVKAALAAGIRPIGITKGYFTHEQFKEMGVWRSIDSLNELLPIADVEAELPEASEFAGGL